MSSLSVALTLVTYFLAVSCSEPSYYFDKKASASYPDGTCHTRYFTCLTTYDPKILISKFAATTPYDCCKTCLSNTNCKSWTHYYANSTLGYQYVITDNPMCLLFNVNVNRNTSNSNLTQGNCIVGSEYTGNKRPNWIIYYPDTIRAEYMSTYGYALQTTPNIDKLAAEGVTFENHIAQHSECSPSRCAMLSGRYMHTTSIRTLTNLLQTWQPNYLRLMKDNGYYVFWSGKNDALSIDSFTTSVNEWYPHTGVQHGKNAFTYPEAGWYSMLYTGSNVYGNDSSNGNYHAYLDVKKFLESSPIEPWIIFIPSSGAHPPYGAPIDYQNMYDYKQVMNVYTRRPPYPKNKPEYFSKTKGIPYYHNLTGFNESFWYQINAVYLGLVTYTDWIWGELYNVIQEYDNNHSSSTGIWVSSDHGDYSGDYNFVEKWPGGLDNSLIHIPLIGRLPFVKNSNDVIKQVTESFDIFKTILDFSNINITFNAFGKSLYKLFIDPSSESESDYENIYGFSEGGFYYYNEIYPNGSDHESDPKSIYWPKNEEEMADNGKGCPRVVSMQNVYYKLVFRQTPFISEFYDIQNDLFESNNLYYTNNTNYQNIIRNMERNLTQWYMITSDATPILMDPRGLPPDTGNV